MTKTVITIAFALMVLDVGLFMALIVLTFIGNESLEMISKTAKIMCGCAIFVVIITIGLIIWLQ